MPSSRTRWIPILSATIFAALFAQAAVAQAGGGGSYSGGRGGGGDGGDGIGFLIYLAIRLIIEAPMIGVPVAIVVVIFLVVAAKKGRKAQRGRTIRRGTAVRSTVRQADFAARLRQSDPGFDQAVFLARVRNAFRKVQDAWCAQDLKPIRPFVSDGIHERFSLQIAEQQRDGWRQGMKNTRIESASLLHVQQDEHFDTVTVRIAFTSEIHRLSLSDGKRVRGSDLPWTDFIECWSFLRRRGATTVEDKGLLEGHCPNCGAPLQLNQSAQCSSCGSEVSSGQHDWVLAEITQAVEWRAEDTSAAPGLAVLAARDPGFSIQHLEDRVSVMFWRKVAADRDGDTDQLAKVATESLRTSYASRLAAGPDGLRTWIGDCAVGSVKTLGFLPADDRDRALVEIRWDGRRFRSKGREAGRASEDRFLQRTLFVLERSAGARSNPGHALISNHCPSCGAPDDGSLTPTCSYCGFVLTDGSKDWVLTGIHGFLDTEALGLLRQLREQPKTRSAPPPIGATDDPSRGDAARWALGLALEDGHIDDEERQVLRGMARKLGIPEHQAFQLRKQAGHLGSDAPRPENSVEARGWMSLLVTPMLDDGRISRGEERLLLAAGQQVGFAKADVNLLVKEIQAHLVRETKNAQRALR